MKSELYLCGKLIDMTDVISFPLNKTFENMSNPTDIVNEWSKTIHLPITKENNDILANAFRLDRTVLAKYGAQENISQYLDPTKKIPFTLINNGDLLIRGYAKLSLSDYSIKDKFYTINLYGDLGDLFQKMLNFAASIDRCPKLENDEDTGKSDIWTDDNRTNLQSYAVAISKEDGQIADDIKRDQIARGNESSFKYDWYDSRYLIDDHMSGDYVLNNEYIDACWKNEPSKKAEDVDLHRAPTLAEISDGEFEDFLTQDEIDELDDETKTFYYECVNSYNYKKAKNDTNIIGFMPTHHGFPNDFDGTLMQYQEESPLTFTIGYTQWGVQKRTEGKGYGLGDNPFLVSTSIEDYIEEEANKAGKEWNAADLVGDGLSEEQIGQFVSWQQKPYIYFNKLFQMFQYVFKRDKEEFGSSLFDGYELEIDDKWTCYDEESGKYINPYWYKFVYTFDFLFNRDQTSYTKTNLIGEANPQEEKIKYNFIFDNELGNNYGYGNQGNRDDYTYYHTEVVIDSNNISSSGDVPQQTLSLDGYYWMVLPVEVGSPGAGWGNNQVPNYIPLPKSQGGYSPKEIFHIGQWNNVMFLLTASIEDKEGNGVNTSMCGFRNYNFIYKKDNLGDDSEYDLQFYQIAKDIIGEKIKSIHGEMIVVDKWFTADELCDISNGKLVRMQDTYNGNNLRYIIIGMPLKALGEINVGLQDYTLKIKGGFTVEGYHNSYQGHDATRAFASLSVQNNTDNGFLFAYGGLWPTARQFDHIVQVPQYQNGFISADIFQGQWAEAKQPADTTIQGDNNLQWVDGDAFIDRMYDGDMYGKFTSDVTFLDSKHSTLVTLKNIYDAEKPLFNIILEYGKMFGLLWSVDYENKKIRLQSRFTTFNGYNETIQDWSNKVDRTKDYQITPILHQSRYLNFDYEKEDDAYHYTDYGEKYSTQYGGYKLKTGYDFTPDSEDVFKGIHTSIFSNRPVITLDDILKYTPAHPCIAKMSPLCLMDCDSKDETSPISIQNWCFRNNNISPFEVKDRKFYIVDDTPLMQSQGKYSYIDIKNVNSIFYKEITSFPSFNIVTGEYGCLFNKPMLDFTTPDEGDEKTLLAKTPNDAFIYKRIWEKWMNERYNTNNKKLTCYINLTPNEYATFEFKNFKIIDGQLFMLNRIIDFNPNNNETTKCEFVQITNPDAYLSKDQIAFTDFDVYLAGTYEESVAEKYGRYYYHISPKYWGSETTLETGDYYDGDNYITVHIDCTPETAKWTLKTYLRPTQENQEGLFGDEIPYGSGVNTIEGQGTTDITLYTYPSFYPTQYDSYDSGQPWDYNLPIAENTNIYIKAESGESKNLLPFIYQRALEFELESGIIQYVMDVDVDGKMMVNHLPFRNTPNEDIVIGFQYSFYSIVGHYTKNDGTGDIQSTYDHFIIPTNNSVVKIDNISETEDQQGVITIAGLQCYDGYYNIFQKYLSDNNRAADWDRYQPNVSECVDLSERCTFIAFKLVNKTKIDTEGIYYFSNDALYRYIEVNAPLDDYTNPLSNGQFEPDYFTGGIELLSYDDTLFDDANEWCRENLINRIKMTEFTEIPPSQFRTGRVDIGRYPMKDLHDYFYDFYTKDGWAFVLFRQPLPTEDTYNLTYTITSTEADAYGDSLLVTTNIAFNLYSIGCPDYCHIYQDNNNSFYIEVDLNDSGYERTFDVILTIPNSDIEKIITIHQYCVVQ